jgi:hypothetical protein
VILDADAFVYIAYNGTSMATISVRVPDEVAAENHLDADVVDLKTSQLERSHKRDRVNSGFDSAAVKIAL